MQIQFCAASTTPIVGATLVVALVGGYPNSSNIFYGYFIRGRHKVIATLTKLADRATQPWMTMYIRRNQYTDCSIPCYSMGRIVKNKQYCFAVLFGIIALIF
jgi:hypothetical protein